MNSLPEQDDSFTMKWILSTLLVFVSLACSTVYAEEDHDEHGEEESSFIELDSSERQAAGVVVQGVTFGPLSELITVPAEVMLNAYATSKVTPRITAQVVKRHVKLGDSVEAASSLVTLSSVAMAEAQGNLIVASREWQRVKKLGKAAVSEKRYTEAEVAQQQALSRVVAYGMGKSQATEMMLASNPASANGEFDLVALQTGTVLKDDFVVGELIEPGRVLFTISDETILWVEAKTFAAQLDNVGVGDSASVSIDKQSWVQGTIVQIHHRLDETTRTQGIRIQIENLEDTMHPGQFAEARISMGQTEAFLSVPNSSITLIDGNATVFVLEEGHEFSPRAVTPGRAVGERTTIVDGLLQGDEVAVEGVFFLKSMLLKSTLGEGHSH